jgi:hypothetical protein
LVGVFFMLIGAFVESLSIISLGNIR